MECYYKILVMIDNNMIESKDLFIRQVMFEALQTDAIEEMLISESKQYIERIANQQSRYLQAKSRHAKTSINTYFAIRFPEKKYDESF